LHIAVQVYSFRTTAHTWDRQSSFQWFCAEGRKEPQKITLKSDRRFELQRVSAGYTAPQDENKTSGESVRPLNRASYSQSDCWHHKARLRVRIYGESLLVNGQLHWKITILGAISTSYSQFQSTIEMPNAVIGVAYRSTSQLHAAADMFSHDVIHS
jgi:hypothetical protein